MHNIINKFLIVNNIFLINNIMFLNDFVIQDTIEICNDINDLENCVDIKKTANIIFKKLIVKKIGIKSCYEKLFDTYNKLRGSKTKQFIESDIFQHIEPINPKIDEYISNKLLYDYAENKEDVEKFIIECISKNYDYFVLRAIAKKIKIREILKTLNLLENIARFPFTISQQSVKECLDWLIDNKDKYEKKLVNIIQYNELIEFHSSYADKKNTIMKKTVAKIKDVYQENLDILYKDILGDTYFDINTIEDVKKKITNNSFSEYEISRIFAYSVYKLKSNIFLLFTNLKYLDDEVDTRSIIRATFFKIPVILKISMSRGLYKQNQNERQENFEYALQEELRREFYLGVIEINKLRNKIPNFCMVYAMFSCGRPFITENNIVLCDQEKYQNIYTIYEEVKGIVFSDFIHEKVSTKSYSKDLVSIFAQIYLALYTAYEECKFVHNDLSMNNIIIKELDSSKIQTYKYKDNVISIRSKYIPVIIDYGRSSVEIQNNYYGKADLEFTDVYKNYSRLIYDFYKITGDFYRHVNYRKEFIKIKKNIFDTNVYSILEKCLSLFDHSLIEDNTSVEHSMYRINELVKDIDCETFLNCFFTEFKKYDFRSSIKIKGNNDFKYISPKIYNYINAKIPKINEIEYDNNNYCRYISKLNKINLKESLYSTNDIKLLIYSLFTRADSSYLWDNSPEFKKCYKKIWNRYVDDQVIFVRDKMLENIDLHFYEYEKLWIKNYDSKYIQLSYPSNTNNQTYLDNLIIRTINRIEVIDKFTYKLEILDELLKLLEYNMHKCISITRYEILKNSLKTLILKQEYSWIPQKYSKLLM